MRRPDIEQWLNGEGVEWRFVSDLPLVKVDWRSSLANQARLDCVLDDNKVDEYGLAMLDGTDMGALVVWKLASGMMSIIDGNHRGQAAQRAEKLTFDCYEVLSNNRLVIERLTRTANLLNGKGFSREEVLEHAKYLVRTYKLTVVEVAKLYRISEGTLGSALRADETRARIAALGLRAPHINTQKGLLTLASIDNDNVYRAIVPAINDTKMGTAMMQEFVRDVRSQRSEAAQLEKISEWCQRPEIKRLRSETRVGKATRQHGVREELWRFQTGLARLLEKNQTADSLHLTTPEDIERFTVAAKQIQILSMRVISSVDSHRADRSIKAPYGRSAMASTI